MYSFISLIANKISRSFAQSRLLRKRGTILFQYAAFKCEKRSAGDFRRMNTCPGKSAGKNFQSREYSPPAGEIQGIAECGSGGKSQEIFLRWCLLFQMP